MMGEMSDGGRLLAWEFEMAEEIKKKDTDESMAKNILKDGLCI